MINSMCFSHPKRLTHCGWESGDRHLRDEFVSISLALMAELAPRDALEGLLVSQIIATRNVAMKCHREAMTPYQSTEKMRDYVNMGGKAVRSLTGLIDTLQRVRGKERQPVAREIRGLGDRDLQLRLTQRLYRLRHRRPGASALHTIRSPPRRLRSQIATRQAHRLPHRPQPPLRTDPQRAPRDCRARPSPQQSH